MLRILLAGAMLLATQMAAQAAPAIEWRLVHPFRYFTQTTDFDMQREALAQDLETTSGALGATAVSDLERRLNDPAWLLKWYRQNAALYPDVSGPGRPERGWAHPINRRKATCWNAEDQWHSSCATDSFGRQLRTDYVMPQSHPIELRLTEAPGGTCSWTAARPIFVAGAARLSSTAIASCGAKVAVRIPFEPQLPESDQGVAVEVTLPDGGVISHDPIKVRDRLIVGIGDSFSSGEGNPDSPVEIDPFSRRRGLNISFVYDPDEQAIRSVPAYSLPVRYQNAPAGWLDRKCHRSAYSYHLRTALQVALADPEHSAVTFLGFACSGAEIGDGLLLPYSGVEAVNRSSFTAGGATRRDMPQVDRITTELCRDDLSSRSTRTIALDEPIRDDAGQTHAKLKMLACPDGHFMRPIDLLIVSIGGNDVGFSPLIVNVLTKARPPYANALSQIRASALGADVIRLVARLAKARDVATATKQAQALPARFDALRKALAPLPIAANADGSPHIILTAFPKIEFNEKGDLCGARDPRERLEGFNVGGVLSIDVPTLRPVSDFANTVLYPATKAAARAGRWTFVDSHRDVFTKHGICAQDRSGSTVSAAENLMLPYYKPGPVRDVWAEFEPFSAHREADFSAVRDTRAYAPRQRWFRTLNDICLFVQFKASGSPPPPEKWGLLDLVESCLGGPFHPTAEGHAHIADAVYAAVKPMLGLPDPTIAALRND